MVNNERIREIVKTVLKKSFFDYYSHAQDKTKHLVLDRIFPKQRRITSYMAGLQTSLGTKFWENIARELADENSFEIIKNSNLQKPRSVPNNLSSLIERIKIERENNGGTLDNFKHELNNLFPRAYPNEIYDPMTKGKGVDLILRKDGNVYIFDIKTVQVNANNGNSFNESVLLWIAYYKYKSGINANNIYAGFVFPYNSSNELDDTTWWTDYGERVKPLTHDDVYVGNEFWSFLTDNDDAINAIISAIDELASDNDFCNLFLEVFDCESQDALENFAKKIRVKNIEITKNITFLLPYEEITNFHRKYDWIHSEECEGFKARISELSNHDFVCPTCGEMISSG